MNLLKLLEKSSDLIKDQGAKAEIYILFIDLKAAFDSVDHPILFEKMQLHNISEEVINTVKFI